MSKFGSVDQILDFAIGEEEKAADFYTEMASKMDHAWMKEVFLGFAKEEMGHKARLLEVKAGKKLLAVKEKVMDLKIGDYLVDADLNAEMDYQQALIVAMKKEKAAFRLYNTLAETTDDANIRSVFLGLAQEEAKHKLRFEIEYDDRILREN